MITAMDHIGDIRAASSSYDRTEILLGLMGLEQWDDLLRYIQDNDPEVMSIQDLVSHTYWQGDSGSHETNSFGASACDTWSLHFGDVKLTSNNEFDLKRISSEWCAKKGRELFVRWERRSICQGYSSSWAAEASLEHKEDFLKTGVFTKAAKYVRKALWQVLESAERELDAAMPGWRSNDIRSSVILRKRIDYHTIRAIYHASGTDHSDLMLLAQELFLLGRATTSKPDTDWFKAVESGFKAFVITRIIDTAKKNPGAFKRGTS